MVELGKIPAKIEAPYFTIAPAGSRRIPLGGDSDSDLLPHIGSAVEHGVPRHRHVLGEVARGALIRARKELRVFVPHTGCPAACARAGTAKRIDSIRPSCSCCISISRSWRRRSASRSAWRSSPTSGRNRSCRTARIAGRARTPRDLPHIRRKSQKARAAAAATGPVPFVAARTWNRKLFPRNAQTVVFETTTVPPPGTRLALQSGADRMTLSLEPVFFLEGFRCETACDPDDYNPAALPRSHRRRSPSRRPSA